MINREKQKWMEKRAHQLLKKKYGVVCEFTDDKFAHVVYESDSRLDCRKYIRRIYKVYPTAVFVDKGRRIEMKDIEVVYYIINA